MKHYVGLDVSMKETFICIMDENGKVIDQGRAKTNPQEIVQYLKKFHLVFEKVGLETGAISHWLVQELKKLAVPAVCIDARKMATLLFIQINKTDKNDARGIADAMRSGLYLEVVSKSQRTIETGQSH